MGPLLFSIVIARTGSYRYALLSLIFFFVVGLVILWFTNTDRGIREAGNLAPQEVAR
jgi:UMF1 family MFS transporter